MHMCEGCGKNPANVHLTQISASGTVVSHLCEECAREKGVSITLENGSKQEQAQQEQKPDQPDKMCPQCGLLYSVFRERGRLGCAGCYAAFAEEIDRMLTQMHGSCLHCGKRYSRIGDTGESTADIARLRSELERAVENEDFEEAARLRDTINALSPIE
jgi:protein arginine kinase activator